MQSGLEYDPMSLEKGPRAEQDVEVIWKDYLKKQDRISETRKLREVLDLANNSEIKPEFQQRAIRTLLDLGVISFSDFDTVHHAELFLGRGHYKEDFHGIHWAQQLGSSQTQYAAEILPSFVEKELQERGYDKSQRHQGVLLDLLPGLPQEYAENLFESFDYDLLPESSLKALFQRDHRYDTWKEKAMEGIRERRRPEQMESFMERADSLRWWVYIEFLRSITSNFYRDKDDKEIVFPGNGTDDQNRINFLVNQIPHVMDIYPEGTIIGPGVDFLRIFDRLPQDLRHAFVIRHLYILKDQKSLLEKLVSMFPDDARISNVLKKLEADEKERMSKVPSLLIRDIESELRDRIKREKEEEEEERIIDLMKKQKPQ